MVYRTFLLLGPRIYNLEQNGDHHENHKEILHQTGGRAYQKKIVIFYAWGPSTMQLLLNANDNLGDFTTTGFTILLETKHRRC